MTISVHRIVGYHLIKFLTQKNLPYSILIGELTDSNFPVHRNSLFPWAIGYIYCPL